MSIFMITILNSLSDWFIHHILFFSQSFVLLFCLEHTTLSLYFSFLSVILYILYILEISYIP